MPEEQEIAESQEQTTPLRDRILGLLIGSHYAKQDAQKAIDVGHRLEKRADDVEQAPGRDDVSLVMRKLAARKREKPAPVDPEEQTTLQRNRIASLILGNHYVKHDAQQAVTCADSYDPDAESPHEYVDRVRKNKKELGSGKSALADWTVNKADRFRTVRLENKEKIQEEDQASYPHMPPSQFAEIVSTAFGKETPVKVQRLIASYGRVDLNPLRNDADRATIKRLVDTAPKYLKKSINRTLKEIFSLDPALKQAKFKKLDSLSDLEIIPKNDEAEGEESDEDGEICTVGFKTSKDIADILATEAEKRKKKAEKGDSLLWKMTKAIPWYSFKYTVGWLMPAPAMDALEKFLKLPANKFVAKWTFITTVFGVIAAFTAPWVFPAGCVGYKVLEKLIDVFKRKKTEAFKDMESKDMAEIINKGIPGLQALSLGTGQSASLNKLQESVQWLKIKVDGREGYCFRPDVHRQYPHREVTYHHNKLTAPGAKKRFGAGSKNLLLVESPAQWVSYLRQTGQAGTEHLPVQVQSTDQGQQVTLTQDIRIEGDSLIIPQEITHAQEIHAPHAKKFNAAGLEAVTGNLTITYDALRAIPQQVKCSGRITITEVPENDSAMMSDMANDIFGRYPDAMVFAGETEAVTIEGDAADGVAEVPTGSESMMSTALLMNWSIQNAANFGAMGLDVGELEPTDAGVSLTIRYNGEEVMRIATPPVGDGLRCFVPGERMSSAHTSEELNNIFSRAIGLFNLEMPSAPVTPQPAPGITDGADRPHGDTDDSGVTDAGSAEAADPGHAAAAEAVDNLSGTEQIDAIVTNPQVESIIHDHDWLLEEGIGNDNDSENNYRYTIFSSDRKIKICEVWCEKDGEQIYYDDINTLGSDAPGNLNLIVTALAKAAELQDSYAARETEFQSQIESDAFQNLLREKNWRIISGDAKYATVPFRYQPGASWEIVNQEGKIVAEVGVSQHMPQISFFDHRGDIVQRDQSIENIINLLEKSAGASQVDTIIANPQVKRIISDNGWHIEETHLVQEGSLFHLCKIYQPSNDGEWNHWVASVWYEKDINPTSISYVSRDMPNSQEITFDGYTPTNPRGVIEMLEHMSELGQNSSERLEKLTSQIESPEVERILEKKGYTYERNNAYYRGDEQFGISWRIADFGKPIADIAINIHQSQIDLHLITGRGRRQENQPIQTIISALENLETPATKIDQNLPGTEQIDTVVASPEVQRIMHKNGWHLVEGSKNNDDDYHNYEYYICSDGSAEINGEDKMICEIWCEKKGQDQKVVLLDNASEMTTRLTGIDSISTMLEKAVELAKSFEERVESQYDTPELQDLLSEKGWSIEDNSDAALDSTPNKVWEIKDSDENLIAYIGMYKYSLSQVSLFDEGGYIVVGNRPMLEIIDTLENIEDMSIDQYPHPYPTPEPGPEPEPEPQAEPQKKSFWKSLFRRK